MLDEALSDWIIEHIPYNLIKALFFSQKTVPKTHLPDPTGHVQVPGLPLCKVLNCPTKAMMSQV